MANEVADALREELERHGATDFRIETGSKHHRFYFIHCGKEMFHVISSSPGNQNGHIMLAVQDVRRMIGANQGAGPGERRTKTRRAARSAPAGPPTKITVTPDPMATLAAYREQMEKTVEQAATETVSPVIRKRRKSEREAFVMPKPTARERAWLDEMLTRGERERHTVAKRRVTPGLAAAMLELNAVNRPITETQVRLHEHRLRRGDFVLTHQGIAFAKTRVLNDGQHRLTAIARSGVTGDLQVTFGAEREEFKVVDMGRTRKASDVIGIVNKDVPVLRSALARLVLVGETSGQYLDQQLIGERALAMQSEPAAEIALVLGKQMAKVCHPTPPAAAYYWIATRSPSAIRVNEFFDGLPSGNGLTGVKLQLREWLRNRNLRSEGTRRVESFWRVSGILLAWNAWLKGNQRCRLDWPHTVEFPEVK